MATRSLWESERWFLPSSLLWPLLLSGDVFQQEGWRGGFYSWESCAEEFDLLLLSPHKGSAFAATRLLLVWGTCFMFHWADRRENHFPCAERKPWWLGSWEWKLPSHLSALSACNMSCQNRWWRSSWQSTVSCFLWSCVVCKLASFPDLFAALNTGSAGLWLRQECVPSLGWECRNPSSSR